MLSTSTSKSFQSWGRLGRKLSYDRLATVLSQIIQRSKKPKRPSVKVPPPIVKQLHFTRKKVLKHPNPESWPFMSPSKMFSQYRLNTKPSNKSQDNKLRKKPSESKMRLEKSCKYSATLLPSPSSSEKWNMKPTVLSPECERLSYEKALIKLPSTQSSRRNAFQVQRPIEEPDLSQRATKQPPKQELRDAATRLRAEQEREEPDLCQRTTTKQPPKQTLKDAATRLRASQDRQTRREKQPEQPSKVLPQQPQPNLNWPPPIEFVTVLHPWRFMRFAQPCSRSATMQQKREDNEVPAKKLQ